MSYSEYNDYSNYNNYNNPPRRPQGHPGGYNNVPPNRRKAAQSAKYRRVMRKQYTVIGMLALFFVAEIIVIALLATSLSKKKDRKPQESVVSSDSRTTFQTSETTTTTTTTAYVPTELLPPNPLAETYWGPLPVCDSPVPCKHFEVKGIYSREAVRVDRCIEIANNSEINSIVIDLKESEQIFFNTDNATAIECGSVNKCFNLEDVVKKCHDANLHVIARIVCFKDAKLVTKYPDRGIRDKAGNLLYFKTEGKQAFASPYDKRNWDYYIELAEEAINKGADEIQFDYVRFPTGGTTSGEKPYYGEEGSVPSKSDAINRFLQTARIRLQDKYGIPVTADIFGIAVTSSSDGDILGQDWDTLGLTGIDSLCPMIYPSHYALGTILNGVEFDKPDKNPHDIMFNALQLSAKKHTQPGYSTVRPYVQAFTASYIGEGNYMKYEYPQINAQIKAIQENGLTEFILWNAAVNYPSGNYGGNNG